MLFNWVLARQSGGTMVLRIEDTDAARNRPEWVRGILDAMAWLGLDYDEGPYYQSQRMDRYRAVLDDMLTRARQILVSELTFAIGVSEEEAEQRLNDALP